MSASRLTTLSIPMALPCFWLTASLTGNHVSLNTQLVFPRQDPLTWNPPLCSQRNPQEQRVLLPQTPRPDLTVLRVWLGPRQWSGREVAESRYMLGIKQDVSTCWLQKYGGGVRVRKRDQDKPHGFSSQMWLNNIILWDRRNWAQPALGWKIPRVPFWEH